MTRQRRAWLILAAAVAAACSDDTTSPPTSGNTVGVRDFLFAPTQASVAGGSAVTWRWEGSASHNVTFEDGQGSSATMTSGTHNRSFGAPGTFRYRCTIHSSDFNTGMVGSVLVQ